MNLKSTFALLVFLGAGAALVYLGSQLPPALDPLPRPPAVSDAGKRGMLDSLTPGTLTRIEIRSRPRVTVLHKEPGGTWSMPGDWPTRPAEVQELLDLFGSLRSRFVPEPAGADTDLA